VDGRICFVIQRKKLWWWVDAKIEKYACVNSFTDLENAINSTCYFDGSKYKDLVIELIDKSKD